MAAPPLKPVPPPIFPVVNDTLRYTQPWADYFQAVDVMLRTGPKVALAVPNNANAAAAGVPIGGLYTNTADPAQIFLRTI